MRIPLPPSVRRQDDTIEVSKREKDTWQRTASLPESAPKVVAKEGTELSHTLALRVQKAFWQAKPNDGEYSTPCSKASMITATRWTWPKGTNTIQPSPFWTRNSTLIDRIVDSTTAHAH